MAVEWLRFSNGGTEWIIRIGSASEFPDLGDAEGYTDPDACEIHLRDTLTQSRRAVVLIHELMHAVLSAPGDQPLFARIIGCDEEDAAAVEEAVVAHLAPKITDALMRLKMLRLPRVPKKPENA